MANYNFRKDLPVAKRTEDEVAELLKSYYEIEILSHDNTKDYDLLTMINDKQVTFEIKEDFMCKITDNVSLEFECRGKPSGIETTKADFYIYKIHTKNQGIRYTIHSVKSLKRMIEKQLYFRVVNGGDKGSNTMNYLFTYDTFVNNGKMLFQNDFW